MYSILIFLIFSLTLVYAQTARDIAIQNCQPIVHQRGIAVGNNNYQGQDCGTPVRNSHRDVIISDDTTLRNGTVYRSLSSEEILVREEPKVVPPPPQVIKEPEQLETGYDYGSEE